jgi:hypothetical protein
VAPSKTVNVGHLHSLHHVIVTSMTADPLLGLVYLRSRTSVSVQPARRRGPVAWIKRASLLRLLRRHL